MIEITKLQHSDPRSGAPSVDQFSRFFGARASQSTETCPGSSEEVLDEPCRLQLVEKVVAG